MCGELRASIVLNGSILLFVFCFVGIQEQFYLFYCSSRYVLMHRYTSTQAVRALVLTIHVSKQFSLKKMLQLQNNFLLKHTNEKWKIILNKKINCIHCCNVNVCVFHSE